MLVNLQQFDVHMMLQFRYVDIRLRFDKIAPKWNQIYGGQSAYNLIWTPSVYMKNERSSVIMGKEVKDLLISIDPSGMVILNTRLRSNNFILMSNLNPLIILYSLHSPKYINSFLAIDKCIIFKNRFLNISWSYKM